MKQMSCGGRRVPKGYRFNPSDEELLSYLEQKNQCNDSQFTLIIPEIDVYKYEPRQLPELTFERTQNLVRKFFLIFFWFINKDEYSWGSQGKWYFFTPRDYKYKNSSRSNRTTGEGFYKITGKDRPIKAPGSNVVIGRKRTLTFYQRGEPKPQRTGWVMHEYYLIQERSDPPTQIGEFVVCCLKYKSDNSGHDKDAPSCNQGSSSNGLASNVLSQAEENWVSKELLNVVPVSNGNDYEAENGGSCSDAVNQADGNGNDDQIPNGKDEEAETGGGMITQEEEYRAYKEMVDELQDDEAETGGGMITQEEEYRAYKEMEDALQDDEAETGGGMITQEEEYRAYKEMEDALQVPNGNPHVKGIQTDPCHTDQTNRSNFVQGQPDRSNSSDMVEEPLDNPENLDSLFHRPAPPQLHQLQPLQEPPIYTTNVPECRKRTYPFEYNDPSLLKKNNISSNDHDIHVSNNASSENQAANVIPKGFSQLELEAVLQPNGTIDDCNKLQSPFGDSESCLVDRNEFSKLGNVSHPLQPQNYQSSVIFQSPIYTKQGNVADANLYNGDCNNWQSAFQPTDYGIIEVPHPQTEINLEPSVYPFLPKHSTLQPQMYTNFGEALHNNECNELQSSFGDNDSSFTKILNTNSAYFQDYYSCDQAAQAPFTPSCQSYWEGSGMGMVE